MSRHREGRGTGKAARFWREFGGRRCPGRSRPSCGKLETYPGSSKLGSLLGPVGQGEDLPGDCGIRVLMALAADDERLDLFFEDCPFMRLEEASGQTERGRFADDGIEFTLHGFGTKAGEAIALKQGDGRAPGGVCSNSDGGSRWGIERPTGRRWRAGKERWQSFFFVQFDGFDKISGYGSRRGFRIEKMHQHTKTDDGQRTALEELWQFTPERITRYRANPKSFRDGGGQAGPSQAAAARGEGLMAVWGWRRAMRTGGAVGRKVIG